MEPWSAGCHGSVRAALDPSLTEDVLGDALIEDDIFLLPAVNELLRRDPDALTYDADGATAAKYRAARLGLIFLVAAEIAPVLPVITAEDTGDEQYARAAWDGAKLAASLRAKAGQALAGYLETDGRVPVPALFSRAPGYRGR